MSGGRRSCLQTKVTQDPLPFGYVSSSQCDGIFNDLDYASIYALIVTYIDVPISAIPYGIRQEQIARCEPLSIVLGSLSRCK